MKVNKILISQPQPATAKSPYFDICEKYGVNMVFKPFIRVERLTAKEFRLQKVNILDHTAVVFTSRHAVDHFFGLCAELRVNVPDQMKYFCISETVALYISKYTQYRKRKIFYGETGTIDGMMIPILKHKTEKLFVPVSNVHTGSLKEQLDKHGIEHSEAVMYNTLSNEFTREELDEYDMMVFFSPVGIESLLKNYPDYSQGERIIACFGAVTAKAVRDAGFRLDIEAPSEGITSMSGGIENFLSKRK